MRLMLGYLGKASLLVDVDSNRHPTRFDFDVINGAWSGTFSDGVIIVDEFSREGPIEKFEILCDNQDRLRGDYNEVFSNFDNPDYVAPETKKFMVPSEWDDDIPF